MKRVYFDNSGYAKETEEHNKRQQAFKNGSVVASVMPPKKEDYLVYVRDDYTPTNSYGTFSSEN